MCASMTRGITQAGPRLVSASSNKQPPVSLVLAGNRMSVSLHSAWSQVPVLVFLPPLNLLVTKSRPLEMLRARAQKSGAPPVDKKYSAAVLSLL